MAVQHPGLAILIKESANALYYLSCPEIVVNILLVNISQLFFFKLPSTYLLKGAYYVVGGRK